MKTAENTQQESSQEYVHMKENSEKSNTVQTIEQIGETPFGIVTTNSQDEANTFVAIGNKRLTPLQPREVSEDMIANKDWTLITQLAMHITEHQEEIKRINELQKQQAV